MREFNFQQFQPLKNEFFAPRTDFWYKKLQTLLFRVRTWDSGSETVRDAFSYDFYTKRMIFFKKNFRFFSR